jgi:hypothetical protein
MVEHSLDIDAIGAQLLQCLLNRNCLVIERLVIPTVLLDVLDLCEKKRECNQSEKSDPFESVTRVQESDLCEGECGQSEKE